MKSDTFPLILKRKTDISARLSFLQNTGCIVRITAAVFFPDGNGSWLVKTHEKSQKKHVKNDGELRL